MDPELISEEFFETLSSIANKKVPPQNLETFLQGIKDSFKDNPLEYRDFLVQVERYRELWEAYSALSTKDINELQIYRTHDSRLVRFASVCNPETIVTLSELRQDSLVTFAAIFNPSTTSDILDEIGLNNSSGNPIIPITINGHKNASTEVLAFFAISESQHYQTENTLEDDGEKYFSETIYEDFEVRNEIDLNSLEALLYLYILGFIDAPSPTGEFWDYIFDSGATNLEENLQLFGSLPAIPYWLYDECDTIIGARCLAGAWTKDEELMRKLSWDKILLSVGFSGLNWQDTRSPRSSVASNQLAPQELLREIFREELVDPESLSDYLVPVFWRLSCNPSTPQDVLTEITSLIESKAISDEFAQSRLLVGEPDDFPFGLITNGAVTGDLRVRVEGLLKERDLNPDEYEILN